MAENSLSTRRQFLKAAPPALAMVAVPVAAVAAPMDAQARYDYHLAEFRKAAEELHPEIHWWNIQHAGGGYALSIVSEHKRGFYEGDGWYYYYMGQSRMVRRATDLDRPGERWFSLEHPHCETRYMSERELEAKVFGMVEHLDREAEVCK